MLMADDPSDLFSPEEISGFLDPDDLRDELTFDTGSLLDMLDEVPDSPEWRLEDLSYNEVTEGLLNNEGALSSRDQFSASTSFDHSSLLAASDLRNGISDSSSGSAEKLSVSDDSQRDLSLQLGSSVHSSSGSLTDWIKLQGHGYFGMDKDIVSHNASSSSLQDCRETHPELNSCNEMFRVPAGSFSNHVADYRQALNVDHLNHELSLQSTCLGGVDRHECSYDAPLKKNNMLEVSVASNMDDLSGISVDNDRLAGFDEKYLSTPVFVNPVDPSSSASSNEFNPCDFGFKLLPKNDNKIIGMMREKVEHLAQDTSSNGMISNHMHNLDVVDGEVLMPSNLSTKGLGAPSGGVNYASLGNGGSFCRLNNQFFMKQENDTKVNWPVASQVIESQHVIGLATMKASVDSFGLSFGEGPKPSGSGYWASNSSENHKFSEEEMRNVVHEYKRPRLGLDSYDGTASGKPDSIFHNRCLDVMNSYSKIKHNFFDSNVIEEGRPCVGQEIHSDSSVQTFSTDDDEDVCILEDISGPARPNFSAFNGKSHFVPKSTVICHSFNSTGLGHRKANGERFVFRAAMEDLCQPKSEEAPPEGLLAVPLLKHQRIALSWMVKKENGALRCAGGFLADDQGLGKTVSTIALILRERSPSSTEYNRKESVAETLNLEDDDDDTGSDGGKSSPDVESGKVNGSFCGQNMATVHAKRRPAAGTLIVCPTSVLRQWSEELRNKVSSKAKLSVLVYHGSNRTKDAYELANYDVVLTTYAIVSMEVPKQPLVDEEEDGTKSPRGLSSSKKRKYPLSTSKKSSKSKDNLNGESQHNRPLAAVSWFRVVLDEAQCIKNHRTQVARACWGLRAKRRWCLSGTPIQNTIDDLYSYFRFLKYDPYWVYKEFCSGIKAPIQNSPSNGYKKLQAVLKTIMLRRTKGTVLDGEPIINLPPKTIKLCKVDFTAEERDFYCRLEADSRAQFAEYAAAGTVKQNYVNILLMLLRLRQACDHRLLVSGSTSGSKSSLNMVKKLPQEKQMHLLNCFEASLEICGLCSDPPEDAVVTSCGHVFCDQCICEHLSVDDTHCPTTNCKAHLDRSSVYSVAALRCVLSNQTTLESNHTYSLDSVYDSSKIKAAIEVLQSVTKRQNCSIEEGNYGVENTLSLPSGGLHGKTCIKEEKKGRDDASCGSGAVLGEKAIVFSQWTRMLDLLERCLKDSSIQYRRLDGTMSVVARDKAVKDFNTIPEVSVMIMSLKAASLGLNMVAACHVLLLDLWWNPTTEDQAIDRAHRIGQTRPVTVFRLTVKDTVEDRILALQQKKREMVANAFGEDETGGQASRLTLQDFEYLFRGQG